MTIDKNIYTSRFVKWIKELKSTDEGKELLAEKNFNQMITLYEKRFEISPIIKK